MNSKAYDYTDHHQVRAEWEAEELDYEDMPLSEQFGLDDDDDDDYNTIELGPVDTMSTLRAKLSVFSGIPVDFVQIFAEPLSSFEEPLSHEVTNWSQLFPDMVLRHTNIPELRIRLYDKRVK
jgi:hypothetical protein